MGDTDKNEVTELADQYGEQTVDLADQYGEPIDSIATQFGEGGNPILPKAPRPAPMFHMSVTHVGLKVKKLPHYEGLPDLIQATEGSSGIDLYSAQDREPILLNTVGSQAIIPTGIAIELPVGFEAQIRPRSGLAAKHGISIVNAPATIDADYRGELFVILVNLSSNRFKVERGMRIAQMVIQAVPMPQITYVDDLSETERGEGRFGSTGT